MAIDYDLDIATSASAVDVAARLSEIGRGNGVFDVSATAERLAERGTFALSRLGTSISVLPQATPHPWHPIVEGLGFTPTVGVGFRVAKGVEVSDQEDDMIRLVSPLLERVEGDAVLHFQYEVIWLLRRNGELSLNERDDIWPPQRLALMTQPYRRETHSMDSE
ncbi:SitI3 family protein [Streptomyces sp. NPDC058457]|uniref:SitI3 family protein n=1 Tax=Streptomyces sp. NPDC058457 TaxID=3346507 RepID=UPI00365319B0